MKQIKQIIEDIRDETEGAEHYAKLAVKYKESDRQLSDAYAKLANVELDHVSILHTQAVRIIRESDNQIPSPMQAVWEWEHEKMTDAVSRIRVMLDMYRQS